MGCFRYPLQPALDAALAREREALTAFASVRERLAGQRDAVDGLATRERGFRVQAGLQARVTGSAARACYWDVCSVALERARRGRLATLRRAERAVAAAREALGAAAGQRTALERLRARARTVWLAGEERREAAEFDEANTLSQARNPNVGKDVA